MQTIKEEPILECIEVRTNLELRSRIKTVFDFSDMLMVAAAGFVWGLILSLL